MAVFLVSANEAKRLRPNLVAGVVFVIGMIVVYLAQLGLNMVLTQDAYYLSQLKAEKRDLNTQVQIIQEEVDSLASPQNLADAANRLGMVANPASVLLDIQKDKVYGKPKPADPSRTQLASANLVANSAMGTVSEFSLATVAGLEPEGVAKPAGPKDKLALTEIPASPTR
jgi:cell division protein FtsL